MPAHANPKMQLAGEQTHPPSHICACAMLTPRMLSFCFSCAREVVNCSTPANYFHLLRRQVHREFRKPLIVISPKNLLKHPKCKDSLDNFDDDAENDRLAQIRFKRLIMDASVADRGPHPQVEEQVEKVLFCTGQIYYKVDAQRQARGLQDRIHMVRLEQLSPYPYDLVLRELRRYPNAQVCWLQEEPKNMGAYAHVLPRSGD